MVKFDLERLRGKKVAVNCVTEEQAQNFVDWVCSLGEEKVSNPDWKTRGEETCYDLEESLCFEFARKSYYIREGYEVISYEEALLKEDKSKKISKRKKIKNLHKALRKKDKKIKNQSAEITLLLKQKKELKEQLNVANNRIDEEIDQKETLKELYKLELIGKDKKLHEKQNIIEYLENKIFN